MRKFTDTLTPSQVHRFAIDFCQPHLAFRSVGKVTVEVLLTVLFAAAAARISSISETCQRLAKAPHEETYAKALYANLFSLKELKRRVNASFAKQLPRSLSRRKRPLRVGIDLTLLPYYGQYALDNQQIYRGQAKRGTNSFFAYATAYLVVHGERFTLAVSPVTRAVLLKEVLQELLALVSKAGLKPGLLLLDRGFSAWRSFATCSGRGGRS